MVLRSLIRFVDRVGSYTDPPAILHGMTADLVDVMGLAGAALWRIGDRGPVLEYAKGVEVPPPGFEAAEELGEAGASTAQGHVWPLRHGGRLLGVLAVVGDVDGDLELVLGMLARRCAQILSDGVRVAMRQTLLEGLSHELRAPLQSLLGYLDLLRRDAFGPLAKEQLEAVDQAARQADRILNVARDVLQVARIDAGKEQVFRGEVELAELVARELETARALPGAAGLDLVADCPVDLRVRTDGSKLGRILTNLLSNAVKFTDEGAVTVRARAADRAVVVEVEDTGRGIPAERLADVFGEYVQLDPDTEGTGLGLSISRRLAKLLDATLEIESQVGRGTTARLVVPANPPAAC